MWNSWFIIELRYIKCVIGVYQVSLNFKIHSYMKLNFSYFYGNILMKI